MDYMTGNGWAARKNESLGQGKYACTRMFNQMMTSEIRE